GAGHPRADDGRRQPHGVCSRGADGTERRGAQRPRPRHARRRHGDRRRGLAGRRAAARGGWADVSAGPLALVGYYEAWWIQIIKAIVIFAVGLQLVPVVLLAERKLLGRFQSRYGPNRVGPYGALQPLADILKLLTKGQFRPSPSIGFR